MSHFQIKYDYFRNCNVQRYETLLNLIENMPGSVAGEQVSLLQVITSVSIIPSPVTVVSFEVVQFNPPYAGGGLEHVRVLSCIPPPQVFEHCVQDCHELQEPLTRR